MSYIEATKKKMAEGLISSVENYRNIVQLQLSASREISASTIMQSDAAELLTELQEELQKVDELLFSLINDGKASELVDKSLNDLIICSVGVLLCSAILNGFSALVNTGIVEADPNIKALAAAINSYELFTLAPMVPLSGISGLLRLIYLLGKRVIPHIATNRDSASLNALLPLLLTSLDGGYVAVPLVTTLTSTDSSGVLATAILVTTKGKILNIANELLLRIKELSRQYKGILV